MLIVAKHPCVARRSNGRLRRIRSARQNGVDRIFEMDPSILYQKYLEQYHMTLLTELRKILQFVSLQHVVPSGLYNKASDTAHLSWLLMTSISIALNILHDAPDGAGKICRSSVYKYVVLTGLLREASDTSHLNEVSIQGVEHWYCSGVEERQNTILTAAGSLGDRAFLYFAPTDECGHTRRIQIEGKYS